MSDKIEVEGGDEDHIEIEPASERDDIGNDDIEQDEDQDQGDHIEVDQEEAKEKQQELDQDGSEAKKEIYTFKAPWTIYGMGWSVQKSEDFRIAIGSFIEDYTNKVDVMALKDEEFVKVGSFDHPYPTTKIMWNPDKNGTDLIGTTGDYMRLWKVSESGSIKKELVMNNNKNTDFCAPLTSFDWNATAPNMVGTASIDTTCTIWDIEAKAPIRQLIAHDREVFDIAFRPQSEHIFASCSGDGSLRQFDLRSLFTSTILYETNDSTALLRLNWNLMDQDVVATFKQDTQEVIIIDVRKPSVPVAVLKSHTACVNAVSWAPHSAGHICTAGDDAQALIWEIAEGSNNEVDKPILAYIADGEINNMMWNSEEVEWISICFGDTMQFLRV